MNGERVFFSDQNLRNEHAGPIEGTNTHFQHLFKAFLHNYSQDNVRLYHKMLISQIQKANNTLHL